MFKNFQNECDFPDTMTQPVARTAQSVYFDLLRKELSDQSQAASREYLVSQLEAVQDLPSDLPEDMEELEAWIVHNTEEVGRQYQDYLAARRAGGGRRYFTTKAHALYFLKGAAPTKLVDGAWLYGLASHWHDARFASLIRIYLEELGEGIPGKNHVALYQALLAAHGCEQWRNLSDDHFVQGAIQLGLAYHAQSFLPEVIGFNLGYEQLPLHLLITSYELNELGIDPYYFTLHVTVDNAATGHARKSVDGVRAAMPAVGDSSEFYRRVVNGYKLNMLGASTTSIIASFDLEREVIAIFQAKSAVGRQVHSDYCRVAGRTVNDWLSDPAQIPAFLQSLEQAGWIKRHQDPQNSRFWKLIQSDKAEMFGVFTAYEQQLIHDWISGDLLQANTHEGKPRQLTYKAKQRLHDALGHGPASRQYSAAARGILRRHLARDEDADDRDEFNAELRAFEETLAALSSKEERMQVLCKLMAPHLHHTAPGLMATRIYTRMLD
jgi:hypothetical protein